MYPDIKMIEKGCTEGRTVIVATHDPVLAEAMAQRIDLEEGAC